MKRVHDAIAAIEPHDSVERYRSFGVDVVKGYATIIDPWTVEIAKNDGDKQRLTTRSIIIAAGAAPFVPKLAGLDKIDYLTSDTLWEAFRHWQAPPKRLLILGGGAIGCELSQAFARLGSQVIQVERNPRLLKREDSDVSDYVKACLQADGVQVLTGYEAVQFERDSEGDGESAGDKQRVILQQKRSKQTQTNQDVNSQTDSTLTIEFDAVIIAVGRRARLTGYGLETLGIDPDSIAKTGTFTNDYLQTLYPNIYAAGDVEGTYQFTHTASHQAWYASVNALFGTFKKFRADYSVIPWVTFIDPEVARVGLNEQQACEQGVAFEVTRYGIDDLDRAITEGEATGWIKVLTVPNKDKILGVTIVGHNAGELLAEYVLAMKHGLGLNKILGTIHTYPTMSEANKFVAGEWKKAHAPQKLLHWATKYHAFRRGG